MLGVYSPNFRIPRVDPSLNSHFLSQIPWAQTFLGKVENTVPMRTFPAEFTLCSLRGDWGSPGEAGWVFFQAADSELLFL